MAAVDSGMISVIIPTLDEARALPATMQRLLSLPGHFEVLVVDGGSRDGTLATLPDDDRIRILECNAGRARQMNLGAAHANGEWLLFLHADTLLPGNALQALEQLPVTVQAGGFRHRFSADRRSLRLVSWLHNLRCRCTRVYYGDQAMFFRAAFFRELGGFPDVERLEDLLLSERVAGITQPVTIDSAVVTDSRKFEQHGVWLSLWRVIRIQLSHELRLRTPARRFFDPVR